MSAVLKDVPQLAAMAEADLDAVLAVENAVYSHPWTRGNFADSLRADYTCRTLHLGDALLGYFVLLVEQGRQGAFDAYVKCEQLAIVCWMDNDENLRALERT